MDKSSCSLKAGKRVPLKLSIYFSALSWIIYTSKNNQKIWRFRNMDFTCFVHFYCLLDRNLFGWQVLNCSRLGADKSRLLWAFPVSDWKWNSNYSDCGQEMLNHHLQKPLRSLNHLLQNNPITGYECPQTMVKSFELTQGKPGVRMFHTSFMPNKCSPLWQPLLSCNSCVYNPNMCHPPPQNKLCWM